MEILIVVECETENAYCTQSVATNLVLTFSRNGYTRRSEQTLNRACCAMSDCDLTVKFWVIGRFQRRNLTAPRGRTQSAPLCTWPTLQHIPLLSAGDGTAETNQHVIWDGVSGDVLPDQPLQHGLDLVLGDRDVVLEDDEGVEALALQLVRESDHGRLGHRLILVLESGEQTRSARTGQIGRQAQLADRPGDEKTD